MKRIKYFSILCLAVMCAVCFTTGFLGANLANAYKETITLQTGLQESGLSDDFWLADDNNDNITFVSENKNFETTVSTNNAYSGSYSVAFKFGTGASDITDYDAAQRVIALGAERKEKIPLNYDDAYFNTQDDNTLYLAFSGKKVYVFDRNLTDYEDLNEFGLTFLGTYYWNCIYDFSAEHGGSSMHGANFELEVVSGQSSDVLNIYASKSADSLPATPNASITLHKKGVADGYVQFTQLKSQATFVSFNKLIINDVLIRENDLTVFGNESLVQFIGATQTTLYDDNIDSKIISKFRISDEGVENGAQAFSLTFTSKRFATPNTTHNWGLVLGVDDSGNLSTGKQIIFAENGVIADTNGGRCVKHCDSNLQSLPNAIITYTIKGYKGGKVEVSYTDYTSCEGHTAIYNNVDFNGKVAFKIFSSSGLEDGFWEISNLLVSGSQVVDKDLVLKIENQDSATLLVGDCVKLSTNLECNLEIADGEEYATLNGQMLTALEVGEVKIKATLIEDQSVFVTYTIQIVEGSNYNFEYKNEFLSVQDIKNVKNSCDFYVINNGTGEIGINNALYFKNTIGLEAAQVGLITPFTHDYQSGIVFDITFTVSIENGDKNNRNKNYTVGFAFGLDQMDSDPLGQGAGAILINCVKAEVYNNGEYSKPTYVTQNQEGSQTTYGKDSFGCYADSTNPLTVRLVAKSDGKLEFYRGIVYRQYGKKDIGTYVSDLFATYSGFDFNGYVSMFTNNSKLDSYILSGEEVDDTYEVKFNDLIVKGNCRLDEGVVPEIKDLGINNTMDLLHTELPIEFDYYIYTVPNLEIFHGYTVEVVSGNATIDSNNRLVTTGAGMVKIKITSEIDPTRFKEIELNIGELQIEEIEVDKTLFDGLTSDSQAFYIAAKLKGENTYITEYLTIDYEVIEGPVSIIDGYLYINGSGNAKIRVYSRYLPSVENIIEFNILDADLQYKKNSTVVIAVAISASVVVAAGVVLTICLIKKKGKKRAK